MENQVSNKNLIQQSNALIATLKDTSLSREFERTLTLKWIVTESLPISTVLKSVEPGMVESVLDIQLTRLVESLNLKWNLQPHQIKTIVEDLVDKYQYESLEDFILIFKRARQGEFGELYRLDSAVIFGWMERYLDEKYELTERLMKVNPTSEAVQFPEIAEETKAKVSEFTNELKRTAKPILPLTEKEIMEEGQERPKRKPYSTEGLESVVTLSQRKIEYGKSHTDLINGKKKPDSPTFDEWMNLNYPPF